MIRIDGAAPLMQGACRVIAEAGVNHNNNVEDALGLVREAANAGAWAVKFQLYKADTIAVKDSPVYWEDEKGTKTQHEAFTRSDKMAYETYQSIAEYANSMGIVFFATPFDFAAIDQLEKIGVPLYKIASADVTNKPLIEAVASTGKPILLSTGASNEEEVGAALEWAGGRPDRVVPLVCTLTYPTPFEDGNFARIEQMRRAFPEYMVGMSDHTRGHYGGWMSSALGAVCIEKHYTLSQDQDQVPDHHFSLEPAHLADLVEACNLGATLRGRSEVQPVESELAARQMARRSLVTTANLTAGTVIERQHLTAKRPGTGLSPALIDDVIGKTLTCDVRDNQVLTAEAIK